METSVQKALLFLGWAMGMKYMIYVPNYESGTSQVACFCEKIMAFREEKLPFEINALEVYEHYGEIHSEILALFVLSLG